MSDAATALYQLVNPEVGASADTWGGKLNGNNDLVDKLLGAITATGSSNAYAISTGSTISAYADGQRFCVKWNHTSSGASTLNVDTIGAIAITKNGTTAIASGDLVSGDYGVVVYDSAGPRFRVVGVMAGAYQPLDALLSAIAGLTTVANRMLDFTGSDTVAVVTYATVLSNIGALNTTSGDARYGQLGAGNAWTQVNSFAQNINMGGSNANIRHTNTGDFYVDVSSGGSAGNFYLRNSSSFTTQLTVTAAGVLQNNAAQLRAAISAETSGALTSASANCIVRCSGNITLPASGMTDGDIILIQPRGTARTITRPGAHTMYISNTDAATGTSGAHNDVVATYEGSSKWTLSGNVV